MRAGRSAGGKSFAMCAAAKIRMLLESQGSKLLCLPRYSPDRNPIENTFGGMKKRREGMSINTSVEELVMSYS